MLPQSHSQFYEDGFKPFVPAPRASRYTGTPRWERFTSLMHKILQKTTSLLTGLISATSDIDLDKKFIIIVRPMKLNPQK